MLQDDSPCGRHAQLTLGSQHHQRGLLPGVLKEELEFQGGNMQSENVSSLGGTNEHCMFCK